MAGRIFLTGDVHGDVTSARLGKRLFPEGEGLSKEDFLVVLGDFGLFWHNPRTPEERRCLRSLADRPWTTLFIDGNHENFDLLDALPTEERWGAPVGVAAPGVYHLRRGFVYDVAGLSCFVFGGGRSVDKSVRTPGIDWWERENPGPEERTLGLENLERRGWKVDLVWTHVAPTRACDRLLSDHYAFAHTGRGTAHDPLSDYLDDIAERLSFKLWSFAHYHVSARPFFAGSSGLFTAEYETFREIPIRSGPLPEPKEESAANAEGMDMQLFFFTNKGNVRDANQDALLAGERLVAYEPGKPSHCMERVEAVRSTGNRVLLAVIDGMGGYAGGELASRIVAESLLDRLPEVISAASAEAAKEYVVRALGTAAELMNELSAEYESLESMGATLAGLVLGKERALLFNVGDCRVYRLRGGVLERVSRDHSEVQRLVDAGVIKEEEMRFHPRKSIVTSAIQAGVGLASTPLFFKEFVPREGDAFFLCSDGVWEALSREEIEKCLLMPDEKAGCEELRERLLDTECRDNVSFVFTRMHIRKK